MNSFQRIMDRIRNQRTMQQNAQAALPFTPNNGNPNGANNMPSAPGYQNFVAPQQGYGNDMSWMNPSPSMDAIQAMLQEPLVMPKPMVNFGTPMPKPVMGEQPQDMQANYGMEQPVVEAIPMPKPTVNFGTPMPKPRPNPTNPGFRVTDGPADRFPNPAVLPVTAPVQERMGFGMRSSGLITMPRQSLS